MTRILSLGVKNFKSFGKFTTLHFSEKLSGVVGPNGSGKSNILDAIAFVLGRLAISTMRAKKGSELIFSSKAGSAPWAEVRLTFDNKDRIFGEEGDQVIVSRRVREDGLSAYRINGKRSTRNQVLDLLAMAKIFPYGHNVVMQGDIIGLINMNAEERRGIIDEIAGIQEYEDKKQKAMTELTAVEAKIHEIDLLIRERERNLERLRREKEQAARYERLQGFKKLFEASIVKRKINEAEARKAKINTDLEEVRQNEAAVKAEFDAEQKTIDGLREKLEILKKKITTGQTEESIQLAQEAQKVSSLLHQRQERKIALEKDIENLKHRQTEFQKTLGELETIINSSQEKLKSDELRIKELEVERTKLEQQKLAVMQEFSKQQTGLREAEEKRAELAAAVQKEEATKRALLVALDRHTDTARRLQEEIERLEHYEAELKQQGQKAIEQEKGLEKAIGAANSAKAEVDRKVAETEGQLKEAEKRIEEERKTFGRLERELAISKAGNPTVTELLGAAVKGQIGGVVGRLKELVTGEQANLVFAAAEDADAVVVESAETAKQLVDYLEKHKLGRITILVVPKKASGEIRAEFSDERAKKAALGILASRKLVDTIDEAFEAGVAITKGGVVVERGRITAGRLFVSKAIEEELLKAREALDGLLAEKKAKETEVANGRSASYQAFLEIQKLNLKLESLKRLDLKEIERIDTQIKQLEANRNNALAAKEDNQTQLAAAEKKIGQLEDEAGRFAAPEISLDVGKVQELDRQLAKAKNAEDGARIEYQTLISKLNNVLLSEREKTAKLIKQLTKDEQQLVAEGEMLTKEIGVLEEKVKASEAKVQASLAGVKGLTKERDELDARIREAEEKKLRHLTKLSTLATEVAVLQQRIKEEDNTIGLLAPQIAGMEKFVDLSVKRLQHRIVVVEKRLAQIGTVNLMALQQFESVEMEFKEIEEKKQKLDSEKQSILNFIVEVEKKKRETFLSHFTAIASFFSQVYRQMTGGEGSLTLETPESIFDGGLIIQASPKGKEVLRIESMSGGEKTMTALAFIFAIQEHQPAPFYVFDEVDAALDKENSDKLADLFKHHAAKSQIIAITHNDTVMKVCDQLIGVYMRSGVSQVVSATPEFMKKYMPA